MPQVSNFDIKNWPHVEVTIVLGKNIDTQKMSLNSAYAKFGPAIYIDCARWIKEQKEKTKTEQQELKDKLNKKMDKCINNMPWKTITVCFDLLFCFCPMPKYSLICYLTNIILYA